MEHYTPKPRPTYKTELAQFLKDYYTVSGHNQAAGFCSLTQIANRAESILLSERCGKTLSNGQEKYLEDMTQKVRAHIQAGRDFSPHREELIELYLQTRTLFEDYQGKKDRKLSTLQGYHSQRLNDILQPGKVIYAVYPQGLVKALEALEARGVPVTVLKEKAVALEKIFWQGYNPERKPSTQPATKPEEILVVNQL